MIPQISGNGVVIGMNFRRVWSNRVPAASCRQANGCGHRQLVSSAAARCGHFGITAVARWRASPTRTAFKSLIFPLAAAPALISRLNGGIIVDMGPRYMIAIELPLQGWCALKPSTSRSAEPGLKPLVTLRLSYPATAPRWGWINSDVLARDRWCTAKTSDRARPAGSAGWAGDILDFQAGGWRRRELTPTVGRILWSARSLQGRCDLIIDKFPQTSTAPSPDTICIRSNDMR